MKKFNISIITSILFLSASSFAQTPIVVSVAPRPMSSDTPRTYAVEIPQTLLKETTKDWNNYVGKKSQGKASELNGIQTQSGAVNPNISVNPFNVNARLTAITNGVHLSIWLDDSGIAKELSNGQQLAVQKYIRDFAVQEYRQAVQAELKMEQGKQKDMEKALASMNKAEDKSVKRMGENQRQTERSNDAITTNNNDIVTSTDKISTQKENVERNAADPNAKKGSQKTLAEMESDKKGLQKDNESQGKKIDKASKSNREEERNVSTSKENQATTLLALENQKKVVAAVQAKLDGIR